MIYLNNAATTWPKPDIVYDTIYEAVRNPFATLRSSSPDAPRGEDALGFFRKEISSFFHISDPGSLVFTPGCTYSLNMAVSVLPLVKVTGHEISGTVSILAAAVGALVIGGVWWRAAGKHKE